MPVRIIKNIAAAGAETVVVPVYTEKSGLFGWRIGRVSGERELRVTCPKVFSERLLRRCYKACVRKAVENGSATLLLPLLLPDFRDEALRVAMESLGDAENLLIWLLVPGQLSPERQRDLAAYMERRAPDEKRLWAPDEPTGQIRVDASVCAPSPAMPFMAPAPSFAGRKELEKRLRAADAGFSETLLKLIDKTGKKDSEIYNRANVSRQHFSKIRNNPGYKPTKPTALAFAIALELDMAQTRDLIGRAGYALSTSSKFDLIIMFFIEHGNYDLFEINEALYEFDQSLLGA